MLDYDYPYYQGSLSVHSILYPVPGTTGVVEMLVHDGMGKMWGIPKRKGESTTVLRTPSPLYTPIET